MNAPEKTPLHAPQHADLSSWWMPFTANRQFKAAPRMMAAAKDMHYVTTDGRQVLDGTSGLWCVNAGHCRPKIVEAIQKQAAKMDYSPAFQMGHESAFRVAARVAAIAPGDNRVAQAQQIETIIATTKEIHGLVEVARKTTDEKFEIARRKFADARRELATLAPN